LSDTRSQAGRSSAASGRGGADPASRPSAGGRPQRDLRDRPFALRLQRACDENAQVPAYNHGRQAWVRHQLEHRFGTRVSNETVSKWFTGVARPRPDKIRLLAQLLEVDEAWLALGGALEVDYRERKIRNAMASGAVNLVAGLIQMSGGHPAFPEENDACAGRGARIDLYAIIAGAHYVLHVTLAEAQGDGRYRFLVPYGHEDRTVIGVVRKEPLSCDLLKLPSDLVDTHGLRRGAHIEVTVQTPDVLTASGYASGSDIWPRITTFAERL